MKDQHLAGPVMDGLTVDEASDKSLNYFAVPSAITAFLVCWWWLRWLPGALLVLAVSVYCEMATISLIHWFGGEMSALFIVLPPLIQVVTASGGIHLINYYLVARQSYESENAAWGALKIGWVPCTLSATTNAIGLGSLIVSQLSPVRTFGLFGALGVVLTLGVVLAFVPGALAVWKPKGIARKATINFEDGSFLGEVPFWTWLSNFVARFHVAIVVGVDRADGRAGLGNSMAQNLGPFTNAISGRIAESFMTMPGSKNTLRHWCRLKSLSALRRTVPLSSADRFNLVGQIQDVLDRTEPIKGTVSVANMMPNLPTGR